MSYPHYCLLVIEDSDEDFEALSRCIDQVNTFPLTVHRCTNGEDALDFLHGTGQYSEAAAAAAAAGLVPKYNQPDLILLDLNLPGTDGREVLVIIKQHKTFKAIPVVVLSTSLNPKDIEACYQYGANSYMLKPMNFNHLKDLIQAILNYWFKLALLSASLKP
jgi:CheY-like chemotaxis protein